MLSDLLNISIVGGRVGVLGSVCVYENLNACLRGVGMFSEEVKVGVLSIDECVMCVCWLIRRCEDMFGVLFLHEVKCMTGVHTVISHTKNYLVSDYVDLFEHCIFENRTRDLQVLGGTLNQKITTTTTTINMNDILESINVYTPRYMHTANNNNNSLTNKGNHNKNKNNTNMHTLNTIGGLFMSKQTLIDMLDIPINFSFLTKSTHTHTHKGALLIGPPGTGKSILVHAIATHFNIPCIRVNGPQLLSKYVGMSEEAVRTTFNNANIQAPSILFFDEIDALAPQRGKDSTGVTDRVVNQMLCYLDGIEERKEVYVLAASSRPDLIDSALLRPGRLDMICYCGIPTFEEKLEIMKKSNTFDWTEHEVYIHTKQLPILFTPADIQAVLQRLRLLQAQDAPLPKCNDTPTNISSKYFSQALANTSPSLSYQEMKRLHKLYTPFLSSAQLENVLTIEKEAYKIYNNKAMISNKENNIFYSQIDPKFYQKNYLNEEKQQKQRVTLH
uniref:Peroxisomal biogenesis factor 1 n=1 Tax=Nephromyces sp. MMRI TaxID=2496275 RepID=A0A3Q8UCC0_9APIC|nr:peroxisomal biogenesis factor 1 [Nephromyces sp. MMRI]